METTNALPDPLPDPLPDLRNVPVLIVENDAPNAKLASVLLTTSGAKTRTAASAEAALDILVDFRPRAIIVDLVLPQMSGLLFIERVRTMDWARDVVIVAMTSVNGPTVERLARSAGCQGYVRKPFDGDAFVRVVAAHLGGAK